MSDIGTAPDCEAPPEEAPWTTQAGAAAAVAESMAPAVHEPAKRLPFGLRASVAIRTACLGWAVKRLAYPVLFAACACYEDAAAR